MTGAAASRWSYVDVAKDYVASVIKEAEKVKPVAGTPEMDALVAEFVDARAALDAAYAYAMRQTDVRPF